MRLWEVLWTGLRCRNFQLLVALAILENERLMLIENKFGLNEILKHINDLAMHIDVEKMLKRAEGMYLQLANVPDLRDEVRAVLGLPLLYAQKSNSSSDSGGGAGRHRNRQSKSNSSSRSSSPFAQLPSIVSSASQRNRALQPHLSSSGDAGSAAAPRSRYVHATEEIDMGHILLT